MHDGRHRVFVCAVSFLHRWIRRASAHRDHRALDQRRQLSRRLQLLPSALHAGAIGLGAACDLTITVPVLYYLLLVRPGHSSWMALVAVTLAGARAAGFLLSAAEQTYLPPLRWLGVPLEIWVVVT